MVLELENIDEGHPIALEFAKNKDALYAVYFKEVSGNYNLKIQPLFLSSYP